MFYKRLDVRLVIFQGTMCRYVHTPTDWSDRKPEHKQTVVLDVWNNHVFTYNRSVADIPFMAKDSKHHDQKLLRLDMDDIESCPYVDMKAFDWPELDEAVQTRAVGTVFWTTDTIDSTIFTGWTSLT